ncbi:MAG: sporulation protein YunB [Clostridia bacterium]|nr:sporulation protein YunB [Clostridia bacterium]
MKEKRKFSIFTVNFAKKRGLYRFFAILLFIFAFLFCYIQFLITPLIVETCNATIKVNSTKCINYAITEAMNQNVRYDDLINLVTDSSGKISMIQANSIQINMLSKLINRVALAQLSNFSTTILEIPLGAFTGISIFSGLGPVVPIDVYPYGDVHCNFKSNFESAGINQTIHKIYLVVAANIRVVLPMKTINVSNSGEVVLCESLIVGQIPDVYLHSGNLTEMLNLIP